MIIIKVLFEPNDNSVKWSLKTPRYRDPTAQPLVPLRARAKMRVEAVTTRPIPTLPYMYFSSCPESNDVSHMSRKLIT